MIGCFRNSKARAPMHGHRAYSGPGAARTTNRMAEVTAAVLRERARRALHAASERPHEWEKDCG